MTTIAPGNPTTCLNCTVLPPSSVRLCPLHAAAEKLPKRQRTVRLIERSDGFVCEV